MLLPAAITGSIPAAGDGPYLWRLSDAAKLAIGEAFARDTADRNEFEVARSWAAFNVDRTRAFVTRLTTNPAT